MSILRYAEERFNQVLSEPSLLEATLVRHSTKVVPFSVNRPPKKSCITFKEDSPKTRLSQEPIEPASRFNIDLQWFAAEDEGRTEDPTEQKIKKAREEGKVVKSSEITSALIMTLSLITLAIISRYMLDTIIEMVNYYLTLSTELDITTANALLTGQALRYFARLVAPIMVIAFMAAYLGNLVQVGFLFTVKPITPDFTRISPNILKWLQRSLFSMEGIFNFWKSIFKVIVIAILAYVNIKGAIPDLIFTSHNPLAEGLNTVGWLAFKICIQSVILLMVLSVPDYVFQRRQHRESLKMSRHDVKEEFKQSEGDPMIKSRLKQRMQQILSANMMVNVPKADVVITNPTHFAIALEWNSKTMSAPTVTAKGQDNIALQIRRVAEENSVPVVENKPLARALYASVDIGDAVPQEYWEVVSRILAEVYRLSGRAV